MIIRKPVTFGEFLAYQEKHPMVKATFTTAGIIRSEEDLQLRAETKGSMTIFLDDDKVYN